MNSGLLLQTKNGIKVIKFKFLNNLSIFYSSNTELYLNYKLLILGFMQSAKLKPKDFERANFFDEPKQTTEVDKSLKASTNSTELECIKAGVFEFVK